MVLHLSLCIFLALATAVIAVPVPPGGKGGYRPDPRFFPGGPTGSPPPNGVPPGPGGRRPPPPAGYGPRPGSRPGAMPGPTRPRPMNPGFNPGQRAARPGPMTANPGRPPFTPGGNGVPPGPGGRRPPPPAGFGPRPGSRPGAMPGPTRPRPMKPGFNPGQGSRGSPPAGNNILISNGENAFWENWSPFGWDTGAVTPSPYNYGNYGGHGGYLPFGWGGRTGNYLFDDDEGHDEGGERNYQFNGQYPSYTSNTCNCAGNSDCLNKCHASQSFTYYSI